MNPREEIADLYRRLDTMHLALESIAKTSRDPGSVTTANKALTAARGTPENWDHTTQRFIKRERKHA